MLGSRIKDQWQPGTADDAAREFTCGFCDRDMGGYPAWRTKGGRFSIHLCANCGQPTYFDGQHQFPAQRFGEALEQVGGRTAQLHEEARSAFAVGACSCAVLACRKLLINLAHEKAGVEAASFAEALNALEKHGWIPPNGRAWVDRIRRKGNEATHELPTMTPDEAKSVLRLTGWLLRFAFDFAQSDSPPSEAGGS